MPQLRPSLRNQHLYRPSLPQLITNCPQAVAPENSVARNSPVDRSKQRQPTRISRARAAHATLASQLLFSPPAPNPPPSPASAPASPRAGPSSWSTRDLPSARTGLPGIPSAAASECIVPPRGTARRTSAVFSPDPSPSASVAVPATPQSRPQVKRSEKSLFRQIIRHPDALLRRKVLPHHRGLRACVAVVSFAMAETPEYRTQRTSFA